MKKLGKNNYMGDDGKFTMFVDLVDMTFAKSSTETKENTIFQRINRRPKETKSLNTFKQLIKF